MNLYGNNDIMYGFKVGKLKWFWDLLLKSLETGNYARNDKGRRWRAPRYGGNYRGGPADT